jgi:hypothetical protein
LFDIVGPATAESLLRSTCWITFLKTPLMCTPGYSEYRTVMCVLWKSIVLSWDVL